MHILAISSIARNEGKSGSAAFWAGIAVVFTERADVIGENCDRSVFGIAQRVAFA
jgi:hypothetical protein